MQFPLFLFESFRWKCFSCTFINCRADSLAVDKWLAFLWNICLCSNYFSCNVGYVRGVRCLILINQNSSSFFVNAFWLSSLLRLPDSYILFITYNILYSDRFVPMCYSNSTSDEQVFRQFMQSFLFDSQFNGMNPMIRRVGYTERVKS